MTVSIYEEKRAAELEKQRVNDARASVFGRSIDSAKYGRQAAAMPNPNQKFTPVNMQARLNVRMCWNLPGETCPFEHCSSHRAGNEAVVFVINNGTPVMLHDDLNLFPSDALITQIRLLADK